MTYPRDIMGHPGYRGPAPIVSCRTCTMPATAGAVNVGEAIGLTAPVVVSMCNECKENVLRIYELAYEIGCEHGQENIMESEAFQGGSGD